MKHTEITEKLCKAREYEAIHSKETATCPRPVFHVSTPVGWMNDPNGFSFFDKEYHLFFQYHPYSTNWGPMHWGHVTTQDFIKWKHVPCALAPDSDYDKDGCFSGTAVEHDGQHILMYTGVEEKNMPDGTRQIRQTQCIAFGDGVEYHKCEMNPVITADMLPEGSSLVDFRDPKIWKDEQGFWSVVGSKDQEGSGQLALFFSENAIDWRFVKILDSCKREYGEMWECPDFFALDETQVLIVSPQFMVADEEFHCGNNTIYFVGEYDSIKQEWKRETPCMLDYGLDFYAAQTTQAVDGRRIMLGWLQNWDNYMTPEAFTWSGMMTVPRELSVRDGHLIQNPVRELELYRENKVIIKDYKLSNNQNETEIPEVSGRIVDLNIHLKKGNYTKFQLAVAADEKHRTIISYDKETSTVCVDRSRSGLKRDMLTTRSMKVKDINGELQLRVLIDNYSVELFVNNGEQAMTTLIYTPIDAGNIIWGVDGNVTLDIEKYDISAELKAVRSNYAKA